MTSGKIISLFSGAGGLDLGFRKEGYDIVYANDYDETVEKTYNENHDTEIEIGDIREIDPEDLPPCDGIIGGPPCQTWSLAGNLEGTDDERGSVFHDYIDIIEHKMPKFFVTENVPGLISKRNREEFDNIVDRFDEIGYNVEFKKFNAAYYNVPQRRKRVVIVGIRDDLDIDYEFPDPTEEEMAQFDSRLTDLPDPMSMDNQNDSHDQEDLDIPNHEYYTGSFSSRFMSRNRIRDWDEPAYTVMANARHQKIHPQAPRMIKVGKDEWKFNEQFEDLYRRYSVHEAAILQTFPEDFEFYYDSINDGYKMVGNAVPVNLARAIAKSINI